jgi:hypothetical protein
MWANCILGVLCFLASCFETTTDGYTIFNMIWLSLIQNGKEYAKDGGSVPNSDYRKELPSFIRCEKFFIELNN